PRPQGARPARDRSHGHRDAARPPAPADPARRNVDDARTPRTHTQRREGALMARHVLERLDATMRHAIVESGSHVGDEIVVARREHLLELLEHVRDDPALDFKMLTDLTVVDYLGQVPRFEVVYQLYSLGHKHRL